jgi:glutamine amidotransferase
MSDVAIIANGGANIASLGFALERLGARARVVDDAAALRAAPRAILPGVGAAGDAMRRLRSLGLVDVIRELRQPVLGICLGMQLLFEGSEEDEADCLGVLPGRVRRLGHRPGRPVPHMGWNRVRQHRPNPLTEPLDDGAWAYFVHGYAAPDSDATCAYADYGEALPAVIQHRNFFGVQFHPERSAATGARLLERFLRLA